MGYKKIKIKKIAAGLTKAISMAEFFFTKNLLKQFLKKGSGAMVRSHFPRFKTSIVYKTRHFTSSSLQRTLQR